MHHRAVRAIARAAFLCALAGAIGGEDTSPRWGQPHCGTNVSLQRIHWHRHWTGVW